MILSCRGVVDAWSRIFKKFIAKALKPDDNDDYAAALCKRCPYHDQCKKDEKPGSNHCFAVLQHHNPLEAEDCV